MGDPTLSLIASLLAQLKAGGDERIGGSLPIGGKAYAGGVSPESRLLTSINPAEGQGHDAYMNLVESMLQDQLQGGQTTSLPTPFENNQPIAASQVRLPRRKGQ